MFSNPKSSTKSTPAVLFYVSESDVKSAEVSERIFSKRLCAVCSAINPAIQGNPVSAKRHGIRAHTGAQAPLY